jgi:hypothetical protein
MPTIGLRASCFEVRARRVGDVAAALRACSSLLEEVPAAGVCAAWSTGVL